MSLSDLTEHIDLGHQLPFQNGDVKKYQSNGDDRITNLLRNRGGFMKNQKCQREVDERIDVHQNSDGSCIDLVERIQIEEQRQYCEKKRDAKHNTEERVINGDGAN